MSIESELAQIKDELSQLKAAVDVRRQMQVIYESLTRLENTVNRYIANTGFEDIPTETKQALNRIYQMHLTLKTAIEADAAFEVLIQGR